MRDSSEFTLLTCVAKVVLIKIQGTNTPNKSRSIHLLKSVDVRIEEEDQALLLLSSLPKSYEGIVDTLVYGRGKLNFG